MINVTIDQAKCLYFDQKRVTDAVSKAQRKVLARFGAYVRQTARSSIRKRKRPSEPGSPPSSHTGLLKRTIFFVYEPQRESLIIGPTLLGKGTDAPRLTDSSRF